MDQNDTTVHPWNNPDWQDEPEAQAGMLAWRDGKSYSDCPYTRGFHRLLWQDGWNLEADAAVGTDNEP